MTKREIRRAAHLLKLWAHSLRPNKDEPDDEIAAALAAERTEHMDLSRKLYAVARDKGKQRDLGL